MTDKEAWDEHVAFMMEHYQNTKAAMFRLHMVLTAGRSKKEIVDAAQKVAASAVLLEKAAREGKP